MPTNENPVFTDVSFVSFTDQNIRDVADHAGVTEDRVRSYLNTKDDEDRELFRAFHYVTGVCPINKGLGPREDPPTAMGSMVGHKP